MLLEQLIPDIKKMIPCLYADVACPEYEALITGFLNPQSVSNSPRLIHMCGLPGAGKSTFYHSREWISHTFIAFDDIMEKLPGYQKDLIDLGSVRAFENWEIPARIIGYELFRRAVENHMNIFFDNGGASQTHLNLIRHISQYGYTTEMHYLKCSVELACQRAAQRQKQTLRHIPVETILHRQQMLDQFIPLYKKAADYFYTYENPQGQFIMIEEIIPQNRSLVA